MAVNQLAELRASRVLVGLVRELGYAEHAIQQRIEQRVLVRERGCRRSVEDRSPGTSQRAASRSP